MYLSRLIKIIGRAVNKSGLTYLAFFIFTYDHKVKQS